VGSMRAAKSSCVGGIVIHSSRCGFFVSSVNFGSVSNTEPRGGAFPSPTEAPYNAPGGGGAGPKSSPLLSESSEGGFGGRSERGAGGAEGPMIREGLVGPGSAGPISLSGLLDRDLDAGGRAGPTARGGEA
jgi:hypothetical protein